MAQAFTFTIEGSAALLRAIEDAEGKIRSNVQNVVQRYAYRIAREAKGLSPVDTGALRASIRVVIQRFAAEVIAGSEAVDYAAFVEFGTRHMGAQPFMRPAMERHAADFLRDLKAALNPAVSVPAVPA